MRRWCTGRMEGERGHPPNLHYDDTLATDGFRASGRQHLIQDRDAGASFGLLGGKATCSQPHTAITGCA